MRMCFVPSAWLFLRKRTGERARLRTGLGLVSGRGRAAAGKSWGSRLKPLQALRGSFRGYTPQQAAWVP